MLLEAAHWDPAVVARTARRHKLPSEAAQRCERGVDPQLPPVAAERAARLLVEHGGGTIARRVARTSARARAAGAGRACPLDLPDRVGRRGLPARRRRAPAARRSAAASSSTRGPTGTARASPPRRPGGRTSPSPPTWSRRCCGWRATTRSRPCCRPRRPGAGSPRRSVAAAPSAGRWPSRATSRCCRSRSSGPRCWRRARAARRRPAPPHGAGGQPAGRRRAAAAHHAAARPARHPRAQPSAAASADLALYEIGQVVLPHREPVAAARPGRRPTGRRTPSSRRSTRRCRPSRCTSRVVLAGDRERRGWWGPGRPAGWADAVEAGPGRRPPRPASSCGSRRPRSAPWHPGRCAELLVGDWSSATPASCTRRCVEALGPARRAPARWSWTSTPCRCATTARRRGCRRYPPVLDRRRAGRGRARARRRRSTDGAARRRRRARWRTCACSTSTPASRSARATGRWPTRCASAPRTAR